MPFWKALVPTARAAAVLAAVAGCSLFVPVVLCAGAAVALLAAMLADAWTVRRPPSLERSLHPVLSLGAVTPLTVVAESPDRRAVALRQPATPALAILDGRGAGRLSATVVAHRRGRHELPGVASASIGPLGLARVHHPAGPPLDMRVYPDMAPARALIGRLRRMLTGHPGLARGALGLGTDFESIREYTPDDDIRQINWRATARLGRPMSNQYRLDRDRDIICVIDGGRLMRAPLGESTLLDVALGAVTVLAMAADELGDRCGAIGFDQRIRVLVAPAHRAGRQVIEALFDFEPSPLESDFERAFTRVGASRRALVVVFTDLVDEAAARSLRTAVPMLARRHAVLVAGVIDPALHETAESRPTSPRETAAAVVARDMLAARGRAATSLRGAGADVLGTSPDQLAARCLDAYLETKARMRI